MKRAIQDKIIQQKINGLEEIPESIFFSAEQSWQQLERKLQPRKKNKKAVILWAAAIFLILFCSIAIRSNFTTKKQIPETIATKKNESDKKLINEIPALTQKIALVQTPIKSITKATIVVPEYSPSTTLISEKKDSGSTATTKALQSNSLAIPEFKDSSKKAITINTPIRNKLRIVHINELNAPRPQVIAVNKNLSLGEIMMESLKLNPEPESQIKNNLLRFRKYNSQVNTTENP
jgi:hypothetical protein